MFTVTHVAELILTLVLEIPRLRCMTDDRTLIKAIGMDVV